MMKQYMSEARRQFIVDYKLFEVYKDESSWLKAFERFKQALRLFDEVNKAN